MGLGGSTVGPGVDKGHCWARGCGAALPRALPSNTQGRERFLITLMSFPCWSLISRTVVKAALCQDRERQGSLSSLPQPSSPSSPAGGFAGGFVAAALSPPHWSAALPLPRGVRRARSSSAALLPQGFAFTIRQQLGETLRVCFPPFVSCVFFTGEQSGLQQSQGLSQPAAQGCADKAAHEGCRP